ncbi:MAG: hypothetical protein DBY30_08955 [Verrucomicrobia bacterium]|nr:MAG: hypothetical protein DBY30_08955 [Verrucomicrobiota bacterium]
MFVHAAAVWSELFGRAAFARAGGKKWRRRGFLRKIKKICKRNAGEKRGEDFNCLIKKYSFAIESSPSRPYFNFNLPK